MRLYEQMAHAVFQHSPSEIAIYMVPMLVSQGEEIAAGNEAAD